MSHLKLRWCPVGIVVSGLSVLGHSHVSSQPHLQCDVGVPVECIVVEQEQELVLDVWASPVALLRFLPMASCSRVRPVESCLESFMENWNSSNRLSHSLMLNYEKCHHVLQSPIYPFSEVCLRVVAGGQLLYHSPHFEEFLGNGPIKSIPIILPVSSSSVDYGKPAGLLLTALCCWQMLHSDMLPDVSPGNRQPSHFLSVVEVMKEDGDKLLRHDQFILFPSPLTGTVLYKTFCCTSHPILSGRSSSVSPLALNSFMQSSLFWEHAISARDVCRSEAQDACLLATWGAITGLSEGSAALERASGTTLMGRHREASWHSSL